MVNNLKALNILGIMSGSSLDGLDLAFCNFSRTNSNWNYSIQKATTLPYQEEMKRFLESAIHMNSEELSIFDHKYGKWIGLASKKFLSENKLNADWIASHGHTIFHQPENAFTLQIGNGNDIVAVTGIPVINDFRSLDVALGGQGAPLVPVGDEYLFPSYGFCLNLGGFSNISYKKNGVRIAFDICPVNMGLNYLAGKIGLEFDDEGMAGRKGKLIPGILNQLNNRDFYISDPPKSLGREWYLKNIVPVLDLNFEVIDILRSFYEHIAIQISKVMNENEGKSALLTGGGAKNKFLVELITQKCQCEIILPDQSLIDFKEALIFAFLGYLRVNNIPNVFSTVTGASVDCCGGSIIGKLL
jgi:anhydro-N-acetylmuramic acid kinase